MPPFKDIQHFEYWLLSDSRQLSYKWGCALWPAQFKKRKKRPKNPASNLFNSINRNANQIASWSDFSHLKLIIVCSPDSVAFSPTIIVSRHTPLPTAGLSRLLSSNVISKKQHKPGYIGDIYWLCEQVLIKSAQKELCNMAYVVISLSDIFLTLSSTKYLSMLFAYSVQNIYTCCTIEKMIQEIWTSGGSR